MGAGIIAASGLLICILMIELAFRVLLPASINFASIEAFALFGIAQQIIGRRDSLELGFLDPIAGVKIGMQLLGQLTIGPFYLVLRRCFLDAQNLIRVFANGLALLFASA